MTQQYWRRRFCTLPSAPPLVLFSVNVELMCFTKKLEFGLVCPQDILPEGFWFVQVCFGKLQSGFLMYFLVEMVHHLKKVQGCQYFWPQQYG